MRLFMGSEICARWLVSRKSRRSWVVKAPWCQGLVCASCAFQFVDCQSCRAEPNAAFSSVVLSRAGSLARFHSVSSTSGEVKVATVCLQAFHFSLSFRTLSVLHSCGYSVLKRRSALLSRRDHTTPCAQALRAHTVEFQEY